MKLKLMIFMTVIIGCANQKDLKSEKQLKEEALVRHSKYRQECVLTSNKYKGNLPSNFVKVWCADDRRKDFGEMGADVIHAIAVAAFYEERMDRRIAAMNLLEKYECKTNVECKEFYHLLDWGIKSGHPRKYSRDLANRANILRSKVAKKIVHLLNPS